MLDPLRTLSARLFTRWQIGPPEMRIRAWMWLAARTDDLQEKARCLEAILELEPDLEWAQYALEGVRERGRAWVAVQRGRDE